MFHSALKVCWLSKLSCVRVDWVNYRVEELGSWVIGTLYIRYKTVEQRFTSCMLYFPHSFYSFNQEDYSAIFVGVVVLWLNRRSSKASLTWKLSPFLHKMYMFFYFPNLNCSFEILPLIHYLTMPALSELCQIKELEVLIARLDIYYTLHVCPIMLFIADILSNRRYYK